MSQVRGRNSVTFSNSIIGDHRAYRFGIKRPEAEVSHYYNCTGGVDETFLPFFGINVLAGRNFMPNEKANSILVSRLACSRMGFKKFDEAIGMPLRLHVMGSDTEKFKVLEIVGVYEDYPMSSTMNFRDSVDPEGPGEGSVLVFKNAMFPDLFPERIEFLVTPENFRESLTFIEQTFKKIFPGSVFNWYFLGDHVNLAYGNEKLLRNQIVLFSVLAIGIACLGLLGMTANKAEEKMKEIGIRKVLGARLLHISGVLLHATSRQVAVAVVLSVPVAFYLSRDYLQRYTDQINMQWWHFASPVIVLMLIMLGTVAVVLYKAAKANPVEALKQE